MRATGLFFLRMNAFVRIDRETRQPIGLDLPVVERKKNAEGQWVSLNSMLVTWKGAEGIEFFNQHRTELRAGRPLQLELDNLHGRDGEWRACVTRLEFAPLAPSWTKAETDQQPRAVAPA